MNYGPCLVVVVSERKKNSINIFTNMYLPLKCNYLHICERGKDEGWRMWVMPSFSCLFCSEGALGSWWFDWLTCHNVRGLKEYAQILLQEPQYVTILEIEENPNLLSFTLLTRKILGGLGLIIAEDWTQKKKVNVFSDTHHAQSGSIFWK